MSRTIRHDSITLSTGVKEEDFEKFMTEELVPFFSEQYRGPTRASIADLKGQSLLKTTSHSREYLWATEWEGSPESVGGVIFEHARMITIEATADMLKKLEAFGSRKKEQIFSQLASIAVATNV
jgi:hypothetical protein